ncbi:hypothetical protein O9929_21135 [Vibrio lentus]|nr:hypothetical protein [Vibrio lentus]
MIRANEESETKNSVALLETLFLKECIKSISKQMGRFGDLVGLILGTYRLMNVQK